jgi:hypothetical protein
VRGEIQKATVDLNGHEAGNGGYSQGTPTACWVLLYSECRVPVHVNLTGWRGPAVRAGGMGFTLPRP